MLRATAVLPRGNASGAAVADRVLLDAEDRHRRRVVMTGEGGTTFLLDLAEATRLRDGDGLLLEDGSVVLVTARPEPLVEVTARSAADLARLAWHIGNRHTEVQVVGERLRIRRDHVLEDMLRGLGAALAPVDAPFDPESGAYDHAPAHGHAHDDDHHHGHDHSHHHHEHDHGHEHGHSHAHGHPHRHDG
ncbi:urease accessory protein UreE [Rhodoplanes roseus]|uniref:Urease accessory protein UreE n=1 Tax=Rhodoplanes roseus TaxID=29409 RepID=A0A327KZX2_9BRAD|nr:urease accessory protein UreE [Rhodoplanes roseus]RAI43614.1 urease accessory protein UreE [Rhodoplanes roseus]